MSLVLLRNVINFNRAYGLVWKFVAENKRVILIYVEFDAKIISVFSRYGRFRRGNYWRI